MDKRVILSLGSNQGDRLGTLQKAVDSLAQHLDLIKVSSVYQTAPFEMENADDFYNICLLATTSMSPDELLHYCHAIESELGRKRTNTTGYESRTIDIDIIVYGQTILRGLKLNLPHSQYRKRLFVLIPIKEIVSDFRDPETNRTIEELIGECEDISSVVKIDKRIAINK